MGSRANLIIIHPEGYSLYYCHWCANTIPISFFWGPTYAQSFIKQQRPVALNDWLDTTWAEGGVVFDPQKQRLLLYGGEDILVDIPLRRLYLQLMQNSWPGWEIRWAHQGIIDIADYVEVPLSTVFGKSEFERRHRALQMPPERKWVDSVGSVRFSDGSLWLFPLGAGGNSWFYLANGPELVQIAERDRRFHFLDLNEWTSSFPQSGFHLEVAAQSLTVWQARELYISQEMVDIWPNWHIEHIDDSFEDHLALTEGSLKFPDTDSDLLMQELVGLLLPGTESNPIDSLRRIIEMEVREGWEVTVNSLAWKHDPLELTREIKEQILNEAILSLR